jgi:hypothetical protein
MSGQDILIEQLREELEKAHAASEYQTRRIEHYRTQLDFCERRAEKAERERDEARAERDARPDISAKDAAHAIKFFRGWDDKGSITEKVFSALRAHAAKAVKP